MTAPSDASGDSAGPGGRRRARFDRDQIDAVCAHYDLGTIEKVYDLPRGSHRAPKAIIVTDHGEYLLKRRAPGRDNPHRMAFVHDLQMHLASLDFPMPALIRTARHGQTAVRHAGMVFEVFEFVRGRGYQGELDATYDAGRMLAIFHQCAATYRPNGSPPHGSYHAVSGLSAALERAPRAIAETTGDDAHRAVDLRGVSGHLREAYADAVRTVQELGLASWSRQAIHSDWHPGNLLYRDGRVVAVLDFDSARWEPRVIDLANGALQFSITMDGGEADDWPDYLDETRLKRFCRGYFDVESAVSAPAELMAIPALMIEALIVEAVLPIAATGSFAHMEGGDFLIMVDRKVSWIMRHAGRIQELISG
jgi:Ser/Thr protein kinase RdoA (MazF antagonist)